MFVQVRHGAPDRPLSAIGQGIQPTAPSLLSASRRNKPVLMFWTIKHGVNMTAMPSFGKTQSDEAIWQVAAFIYAERGISKDKYDLLVHGNAKVDCTAASLKSPPLEPCKNWRCCSDWLIPLVEFFSWVYNVKPIVIALQFAVLLTACTTEPSTRSVTGKPTTRSEIVDYAGHVCGDQNIHVKMPVCLFPRVITQMPVERSQFG
jgi:hypothetical protein